VGPLSADGDRSRRADTVPGMRHRPGPVHRPQHTLLSVCYCGHPRSYDYKHQDETCPCLIGAT